MIDKSSLLKSQGSLYLEFIPKDGLFHKMLLLSLMGFLTGWCNLKLLCDFARISHFLPRNDTNSKDFVKKSLQGLKNILFLIIGQILNKLVFWWRHLSLHMLRFGTELK